MKKIRQRNDIDIVVQLKNNEGLLLDPTLCSDMIVCLTCGSKKFYINDFEKFADGRIKFRFLAEKQTKLGVHNVTISAVTEDGRTFTTDACNAFNLVACSCNAGDDAGEVNVESVEVDATFEISAWGTVSDIVTYEMPSDFIPQDGEEVSKEITNDVFQSIFGNIDEFINNVKTKHIRLGIPYFIEDMDVTYTAVVYIDVTSSLSVKISPTGEETVYTIGISGSFSLLDASTVVLLDILCNSTDMMGSWTAKKETTPAELEAKINNILVDFGTVGIGNVYRTIWQWGQTHHAGNYMKPLTLRIESQFRGNPSHLETFVGTAQWIYGEGRKGAYHLIGSLSGDSEDGSKLVEILVYQSGIVECKDVSTSIIYNWDSFDSSVAEGTVSQEVYDNLLKADVVTSNGDVFTSKWIEGTSITLVLKMLVEGGEEQVACDLVYVTVKEDLTYTIKYYGYNLPGEDFVDKKLIAKQDILVSGENIKTINNQSILGKGNITIEGGSGGSFTPKITSTLNVTSVPSIQQAQATLKETYSVGFFLIADDKGSLPSSNKEAVVVSPPCQKQLSLSSPNPSVQNILNKLSADNFKEKGMNVGDIIALARVPVSIDDLAKVVGLSSTIVSLLKALGLTTIEVFQYKVWATTGTKWKNFTNPDGTIVPAGTEGLMSVYDKEILDANNLSTKYGYGTNFDDCLQTGICAYSPAYIGGVTENFTLVVQSSSNVDSGGFNSIIQTAYGRTGAVYNRIFQRMIFHNPSSGTRAEYHAWVEITGSNDGSTKYFTTSCSPNVIFSTLESAKVNGFAEVSSETEDGVRGYTFKGYFNYVPTDGSPYYMGVGMIGYNDTNLSEPAIMIAHPYNHTQIIGATRIADLEARIKALEDKLV